MDTSAAFMMRQMARAVNAESKVFDWDKAASLLLEYDAVDAYAGLKEDWVATWGEILRDGKIVAKGYMYLASNWATPVVDISSRDGKNYEFDCYKMEHETEWDANTRWPSSAKKIYKKGKNNGSVNY